jgi:nucleotide-binding universal stress UspA family protein
MMESASIAAGGAGRDEPAALKKNAIGYISLAGALLGSVSHKLVHVAERPVLVVPS